MTFLTQEIGSIAKPGWRVKFRQGKKIEPKELAEARSWGERIGVETEELVGILKAKRRTPAMQRRVEDLSALYGIRFLEAAGLDVVWDGEQRRSEMYQYAVERCSGFKFLGHARSWDNKYYLKAACIAPPKLRKPYHTSEFAFIKQHTSREIKVPVTGAFTLADWSFNQHYENRIKHSDRLNAHARHDAKRELTIAIAKNVLRPVLADLVKAGARRIQIDEPAATTKLDETDIFVEAFNESVKGLDGRFSVHLCFSDYKRLFPHVLEMKECKEYAMEFANRDGRGLGTTADARPGYAFLDLLKQYDDPRTIGLGVVDVHSEFLEPAELIGDRLLYAASKIGAERVNANPDCGLRTRSWEVTFRKLQAITEGAAQARKTL